MKDLTAAQVAAVKTTGKTRVSPGLYLHVSGTGRRWVFRYTDPKTKRVSEKALGPCQHVTLAQARAEAATLAGRIYKGESISPKVAAKGRGTWGAMAEEYIAHKEKSWSRTSFIANDYALRRAFPDLTKVALADVTADVLRETVLPLWQKSPVMAKHVVQTWRAALSYAVDCEMIETSPAAKLLKRLPEQGHVTKHHPAMKWEDVPAFIARLRSFQGTYVSARALEFIILCGSRTSEVLGMRWDEVDLTARLWTCPAPRMKGRATHVTPLSARCIELLKGQPKGEYVWPGRNGGPLTLNAIASLMRNTLRVDDVTTHGFRTTYRTFLHKHGCPVDLGEEALAHKLVGAAGQAYLREGAAEQRRPWADIWASHLEGKPLAGNVVPFGAVANVA